MKNHVLATNTEGNLSNEICPTNFGDTKPGFASDHRHDNISYSKANRERTHASRGTRMRVAPNNDTTRLSTLTSEISVHDTRVSRKEVNNLGLSSETLCLIYKTFLSRLMVGAWISSMISCKSETVVRKWPRSSHLVVGLLHAAPEELGCKRPVDFDADHISRLDV